MDYTIYEFSLFIALPLMLFFGFYFLLAKIPEKVIFGNYLRSRRIMGIALLLLAANYSVHFFFGIRFNNANAAILMNLSTYFLFSILSCIVLMLLPEGILQTIALFALAAWLVTYGFVLARRLILAYNRAIRIFNETYSDDIGAYIKWLSIFTWWAVIFGVGCGLLTFLPDKYVYIWILSSIPFYGYLFYSYQNYMIFYEQVERTLEIENAADDEKKKTETEKESPKYFDGIESSLTPWLENKSYTQSGFTIQDMAKTLGTNRTYLNAYIKDKYHATFREWITGLRLEYAKNILKEHPEINVQKLAEASGFLSRSNFTKSFADKEGCTPAKWRKANLE